MQAPSRHLAWSNGLVFALGVKGQELLELQLAERTFSAAPATQLLANVLVLVVDASQQLALRQVRSYAWHGEQPELAMRAIALRAPRALSPPDARARALRRKPSLRASAAPRRGRE
jgi:hypothetical protein